MSQIAFNEAGFNQLVSIVESLAELVEAGATINNGSADSSATPRVKSQALEEFAKANPGLIGDDAPEAPEGFIGTTDVFAYQVPDSLDGAKVCNRTGLPGHWVQSKSGKRFMVDGMGVPFFLYNPLRDGYYAARGVVAQPV